MATTLGSKSVSLTHLSVLILRRTKPPLHSLSTILNRNNNTHCLHFPLFSPKRPFSSKPATPFPLQYDMILSHPQKNNKRPSPVRPNASNNPPPSEFDPSEQNPERDLSKDLSFEDWVDFKLSQNDNDASSSNSVVNDDLDKEKRKYYNKRKKRMYGSDSEDEMRKREREGGFVELKPEVVEFRTLHKREEELYFYDAFALPWEKDKHYKMVYQLEKKYFPDQCLDKAFLEPGHQGQGQRGKAAKAGPGSEGVGEGERDKGLVFFEEGKEEEGGRKKDSEGVSEKKVEEFFKCLKNVPKKGNEVSVVGPFLSSRSIGLPPQWDGVGGTVVLVNKPKGESLCHGLVGGLYCKVFLFSFDLFAESCDFGYVNLLM